MKKLLVLTAIGLTTLVSINNLKAADNRTEEHVGFGSGLVIGAVAGGPVGAIIGAASGAWLGDQLNEAKKVDGLNKKITEHKVQLDSLQVSLAEKDSFLDQAKLLLAEQQATQIKVSRNRELMTGLQIDLMFRTNSRQLETGAINKIAPLVLMLEHFPQLELELTGHGDVLGGDDANNQVALERARTVKRAFTTAGVEEQRIHLVSEGRNQATAIFEDIEGRAMDRRVRVRFMFVENQSTFALQ